MPELNWIAVVVAAVAVFAFAAVYYSMLAAQAAQLNPVYADAARPGPSFILIELARALIVAAVVAALARLTGVTDLAGAIFLGLALWVAFPVVLLVGSVVHEKVPPKLAAIHAGDWLVKLLVIAVIVTIWR